MRKALLIVEPALEAPQPDRGGNRPIIEIEAFVTPATPPASALAAYSSGCRNGNEVISFVKQGLNDLSISRTTIKWGIPVAVEGPHVFYVWFDALTAYMSAVEGEDLWPADLHLIGKEILRFHAVYWPAFLMAADLPLPKRIFAHGWLLFENDKMSKSRGNIVRAEPIREVMGADALRYFLLREVVFGQDGSFSYDALIGRYNSDLANGLGNLASRTLTMIHQYRGGVIPEGGDAGNRASSPSRPSQPCRRLRPFRILQRPGSRLGPDLGGGQIHRGEQAPWKLARQNGRRRSQRLDTTLYTAAEALRIATALLSPVLPESTPKIWAQLGMPEPIEDRAVRHAAWGELAAGPEDRRSRRCIPAHRTERSRRQNARARRAGHRRAEHAARQDAGARAEPSAPETPKSPSTISSRSTCASAWCFPPSASRAPTNCCT